MDLQRKTAWLNQTKNGTPRRTVEYRCSDRSAGTHGEASDNMFHLSEQTYLLASNEHGAAQCAQAGTHCDKLKDLGGWKSRQRVDRYAKFATNNLQSAAARIERDVGTNVIQAVTFLSRQKAKKGLAV